jgi:hypothetical protein
MSFIRTIVRSSPKDLIIVPMKLAIKGHATLTISAVLDTGADHTCISRKLLESAGVVLAGKSIGVVGISSKSEGTIVSVDLEFPMDGPDPICVTNHDVAAASLVGSDALLGRDFLQWFDVTIHKSGLVVLRHE